VNSGVKAEQRGRQQCFHILVQRTVPTMVACICCAYPHRAPLEHIPSVDNLEKGRKGVQSTSEDALHSG
jgi:hypothetical protein